MTSSPSLASLMLSQVHVRGRIPWFSESAFICRILTESHQLSRSQFLLTSRRKPLTVLKPFSLNFTATEKSARKGGRQRRGNTSRDLPPDQHATTYHAAKLEKSTCDAGVGEMRSSTTELRSLSSSTLAVDAVILLAIIIHSSVPVLL